MKKGKEHLTMFPKEFENNGAIKQYYRQAETKLTKEQLKHTTLLIGGLSTVHIHLVVAGMHSLGINCLSLPVEDKEAGVIGREYGNNGYCNPVYFTTGNLIKFLNKLRSDGMETSEIIDKYAMLTIGCGDSPCRFGMYESQYRQSLDNAGYKDFRVIIVEQTGGLNQQLSNIALKFDVEFFLMLVNSLNSADLINSLVYSIRPYEINEGQTNRVLDESLSYLYEKFKNRKPAKIGNFWSGVYSKLGISDHVDFVYRLIEQFTNNFYTDALKVVKRKFDEIEVDRFRLKPVVKITGEFWATVTQGDGNYRMFSFLESEGAEVKTDYVATYISYLLYKSLLLLRNKKPIYSHPWQRTTQPRKNSRNYVKQYITLYVGEKLFEREFNRLRMAIGGTLPKLVDQRLMKKISQEYYPKLLSGGEAYMEIAKNILYHKNHLAHMVLSIKPFGCMPSTLSDGIQVKVIEKYKDMIFIPIETSGEGEINAHSRVQMALFDARIKAKQEFERVLNSTGKSLIELKNYWERTPEFRKPFYPVPHIEAASVASGFVCHLAQKMKS